MRTMLRLKKCSAELLVGQK